MADHSTNPSFLLGQLVATAELLQEIVESLEIKVDYTALTENIPEGMDAHELSLLLLKRELEPYEKYLYALGKEQLLADMKRIHTLKVKYDFEEEHLDQELYQLGYQEQLDKYNN